MKPKILILTILITTNLFAQKKEQGQDWTFGISYTNLVDMEVFYIDSAGTESSRTALAGLKYRYVGTINDKIYIKFLKITSDQESLAKNKPQDYVSEKNWNENYFVKKSKFMEVHRRKNGSLVTGTLLAPIKIRPDLSVGDEKIPWELSTDISLGQYLGYRIPITKTKPYFIIPTLTIGTSLLSINSSNTAPEAETTTTLGITWSTGLILDLKGFNVGILLGKDYAPGKAGKDWIYNEKTWFSLGFGINLTSKNKDL